MSTNPECVSVGEALRAAALEQLSAGLRLLECEETKSGAASVEMRSLVKRSVILAASYGALSSAEAAKMIESLGLREG